MRIHIARWDPRKVSENQLIPSRDFTLSPATNHIRLSIMYCRGFCYPPWTEPGASCYIHKQVSHHHLLCHSGFIMPSATSNRLYLYPSTWVLFSYPLILSHRLPQSLTNPQKRGGVLALSASLVIFSALYEHPGSPFFRYNSDFCQVFSP